MFQGSMVALVTPMHANGEIDYPRLGELVEWHIASGTDAIVAVGTTGESATVDFSEHCQIIQYVVEKANKRLPVIAGTGSNSTQEALELGRCALKSGADACLVVTPYYNKPTQEGLYQHYKYLAEQVNLPLILYNVPGRTAVDMLPATVSRLAKVPGIVGLKEASGSLTRIDELVAACGNDFFIYSGDDDLALEMISHGTRGVISVTANIAPAVMHAVFSTALAGDMVKARELNEPLLDLHRDLFLEANPIPVKWALAEMGRMGPDIRLPLTQFSQEHHAALRNAMLKAQLI